MAKKPYLPVLAFVAVLAVAATLRLWRLPALPPGLWYDEAVNGVDIRMVLSGQGLPLYFAANGGREPLFIYLQALGVALFGPSPFSLRLVAALAGVGAVAAVYTCGKALFAARAEVGASPRGLRVDARWTPILAAAVLAVTYWSVSLSRLGLRAALLPLVSALAMATFWQGWAHGRRRAYAWAGLWFALCLYTYTSARVLPFVPALFILSELLVGWAARRNAGARAVWVARWRGIALALLVGVAVTLPLAVETARHPALVLGRMGEVRVASDTGAETGPAAVGRNALLALRAFYDRGDANARHNLPGRPVTDPLTALLFTAGVLHALLRLRDPRARLLLIWFGVMLLPSILSGEVPHSLRAAGALPPYALLAGMGGAALTGFIPERARRAALPALIPLVLLVSGALTARDYFSRWATHPALAGAFSVSEQAAAAAAGAALEAPGGEARLSQRLYRAPNMVFRLGAVDERLAASPPPTGEAQWRLSRSGAAVSAELTDAHGAPRGPEVPLDLRFANGLRLVGYDAPATAPLAASAPLTLTLYWQADPQMRPADLTPVEVFAHLSAAGAIRATANGVFAENHRLAWPALRELIVDQRAFALPPDIPPGKAVFEVGLYTRRPGEPYAAARRVPLVDANGNIGGDQVTVAPVMLGANAPAVNLEGTIPLEAAFEDRIALVGWRARAENGALRVAFCWAARRRIPTDLTAFVHLIDAADNILSQGDAAPGGTDNPTSRWVPGETVCSDHFLALPSGGLREQRVRVGLYEPVSERQWRVAGPGLADNATFIILLPNLEP